MPCLSLSPTTFLVLPIVRGEHRSIELAEQASHRRRTAPSAPVEVGSMKTICRVTLVVVSIMIAPIVTNADVVDLTRHSSGTANGAVFTIDNLQPAGTGVIQPFLTIQRKVSEQGYNSGTNDNFDTKRVPQWNHEITLGSLAVFTMNGTGYYQFLVDVNEPNGGDKSLITLDALRVYTSSTRQNSTSTDASGRFNGSLGAIRYDLGTNSVLYDDQHHGSGQADISIFIPVVNFTGASSGDFVYMYQGWGYSTGHTDGGFEETTALVRQSAVVPEPATSLLLGAALIGAAAFYRRIR
jgi:PEP-CTERM motif-containing protein